jgi:hypothetical protein
MYLYWFRPYRGGDGIIRLSDTKSDELKPGKMIIAINCNWIQISIVSWIRDILVRIRIRRSVPLTYGSEFILGSGSGFKSGFRYRIQGSEKHRIQI